jgi:hypothetical protein
VRAVVVFAYRPVAQTVVEIIRSVNANIPIFGIEVMANPDFYRRLPRNAGPIYAVSPFVYELAARDVADFRRKLKQSGSADSEGAAGPTLWQVFGADGAKIIGEALAHSLFVDKVSAPAEVRKRMMAFVNRLRPGREWVPGMSGNLFFEEESNFLRRFPLVAEVSARGAALRSVQVIKRHEDTPNGAADSSYLVVPVVTGKLQWLGINKVDLVDGRVAGECAFCIKCKAPDKSWNYRLHDVFDVISRRMFLSNEIGERPPEIRVCSDTTERGIIHKCYAVKGVFGSHFDFGRYPFYFRPAFELEVEYLRRTASDPILIHDRQSRAQGAVEGLQSNDGSRPLKINILPAAYVKKPEKVWSDAGSLYKLPARLRDLAPVAGNIGPLHTGFKAYAKYRSRVFPHMFQLCFPICVMLLVGTLAFLIGVDQFGTRLATGTGVLVTVVIFHLSKDGDLPPLGYLTAQDWVFLAAFSYILCLVGALVYINLSIDPVGEEADIADPCQPAAGDVGLSGADSPESGDKEIAGTLQGVCGMKRARELNRIFGWLFGITISVVSLLVFAIILFTRATNT